MEQMLGILCHEQTVMSNRRMDIRADTHSTQHGFQICLVTTVENTVAAGSGWLISDRIAGPCLSRIKLSWTATHFGTSGSFQHEPAWSTIRMRLARHARQRHSSKRGH